MRTCGISQVSGCGRDYWGRGEVKHPCSFLTCCHLPALSHRPNKHVPPQSKQVCLHGRHEARPPLIEPCWWSPLYSPPSLVSVEMPLCPSGRVLTHGIVWVSWGYRRYFIFSVLPGAKPSTELWLTGGLGKKHLFITHLIVLETSDVADFHLCESSRRSCPWVWTEGKLRLAVFYLGHLWEAISLLKL